MRVRYKLFRGLLSTWDELFSEAAGCAEKIGPERLINVSHANSGGHGSVTVWYWVDEDLSVD